jgi:hypothetical protein
MIVEPVRAFFEAERQRPRWRGLAIITIIACTPLLGNLVLVSRTPQGDQPVVALATSTGTVEAPAFALVSLFLTLGIPFFFWLLYTAIAHLVTAVFDGEGSFTRYATLFAWGLAPGLGVQLFWLGALVANATAMEPPADPSQNAAWIEAAQSGPAMAAVDVLYPATVTISFGLWVLATAVGRRVTTRQAALAVLPALVIELVTYYVFAIG